MEDPSPLIEYIVKRITKNLNAIILFNGATGSGKSYATLDMALRLSKRNGVAFSIENNLAFNFKDLLKKMKMQINTAPGTIFIFEEVGAIGGGAASREWQSKANAFFQSFMQTSRHRNQILLFNCPLFAFLEKGTRSLVHIQITMQQINRKLKQSIGKPFIIQTNAITGKQYFKYLRYRTKEDNAMNKLGFMKFELPPKEIIDVYEPMKQRYSDKLDKSILEDDNHKPSTVRDGRSRVPFDYEKVVDYRNKNMKNSEIADIFRISVRRLQEKVKDASKLNENNTNPKGNAVLEGTRPQTPPF